VSRRQRYEQTGPTCFMRVPEGELERWRKYAQGVSLIERIQRAQVVLPWAMRVESGDGALWLELRDRRGRWVRVGDEQRRPEAQRR